MHCTALHCIAKTARNGKNNTQIRKKNLQNAFLVCFFMGCWYVGDDVACKRCIRFKFQESSENSRKKNC